MTQFRREFSYKRAGRRLAANNVSLSPANFANLTNAILCKYVAANPGRLFRVGSQWTAISTSARLFIPLG